MRRHTLKVPMKRRLLLAVLPLLLPALPACSRDAEERHLDEMSQQIDHLQVDRDEENARTLAAEAADSHLSTESLPARRPAPSEPPPPVMNLGDEGQGDGESPDTEDPAPRPSIRVYGSQRGSVRGSDDGTTSFVDDGAGNRTAVPSGTSSALDPAAKPAYEAAIALVSARQYDRALDALAAFLVKWPDHPYADNAMYWRGECYFAKGDYLHAAEQFEGVVTRFPAGNKAPDALLKLGITQQKLGNPYKAKEYFDRLAQTYPQSAAAHRIPPVTVQAAAPTGPASEDHR
jgi:tol-pal system protein YbgF